MYTYVLKGGNFANQNEIVMGYAQRSPIIAVKTCCYCLHCDL